MERFYNAYEEVSMSNIIEVKVYKSTGINIPKYQSSGASGFDFETSEDITINPDEVLLIGTGLKMDIPKGFELQVRPRSGISYKTKLRIANSPGSIDSDYRGEIKIIMHNIGKTIEYIKKGDRIAQGVFSPVYQAIFKNVNSENDLKKTNRGENGFGSTGV